MHHSWITPSSVLCYLYKYKTPNSLRIFNPSEFGGTNEKCKILSQYNIFFVVLIPETEIKQVC